MSGLISIYLDIFRFVAAMGVFMSHAEQHTGAKGVLPPVYFDHKLVVFFFVISGYVIAASASRADRTLANYTADRLARLSSVVIPSLLLTYFLDAIGMRFSPGLYDFDHHNQLFKFVVNFFYCQQLWWLSSNPSSNTPLWSLGYEFWYYALFGIWVFIKTKWVKAALLLLVSLLVGPKILLLLPAWLVGAVAFHIGKNLKLKQGVSLALFIASGVLLALASVYAIPWGLTNGEAGHAPLYFSANYGGDDVFSLIVAAHFLFCAQFSKHLSTNFEPYKAVKFIRWLASHTFSLYVYHMPILYFIRAVGGYDANNLYAVLAAILVALLLIAGLSKVTEEQYPVLRKYLRLRMMAFMDKVRVVAIRWKLSPAPGKTT